MSEHELSITITEDGPYIVRGGVPLTSRHKVESAEGEPLAWDPVGGKPDTTEPRQRYALCRCGQSENKPFCDGSHAGTDIEPLMFTAERTETALLCGCKDTGDPPYCDGSHLLL